MKIKNLNRNLNKLQKLSRDRGARVVLKKIIHLAKLFFFKSADKRTKIKRNAIFRKIDHEVLIQDVEKFFSVGLFRALDEIETDLRAIPIDVSDRIINEAQRLIYDQFSIYGHLKIQFGKDQFSWLRDPLTSFLWPQTLTRAQLITQKPYGTDIKTIWEIARFQFLLPLNQAYMLTGEEQYARFAVNKVNSWVEENHFLSGPHWTVAMESSIRLLNWCLHLPFLNVFKYTDFAFKTKITQSILEHFIFIRENLEVSPSGAGNHYFADIVGLLLARLIFPSLSWAVETSEFAEKEFYREVQRQFTASGINFEGSLPYHRLSSEMLLIGVALIKKSGREASTGIYERLRKIRDFTIYYTSTCADCPTIGDNDSGIFVKFFSDQESNRHRYLRYLFDCILGNKVSPNNWEGFLCSIHFTSPDPTHITITDGFVEDSDHEFQVKDFNGLVIAKHKSEALFFNTLHSSEGHTHNDKLSIYPIIEKKSLFIDRGSFSYTGFIDKRHEDRKTSSHNGPVINGWEQSRIWKNDSFYINGESKCSTSIDDSNNIIAITGCHSGYLRYSPGIMVFRKAVWNAKERTILISDWVESEKEYKDLQFTWTFLLNPQWGGVLKNSTIILKNEQHMVYFEDIDGVGFTLTQGLYCPNYQIESPCQTLKASWKARPGDKIHFLLSY